jgi:penicillin-binding protein 1A
MAKSAASRSGGRSLLKQIVRWTTAVAAVAAMGVMGLLGYYATYLPDISTINKPQSQPMLTVLANDGSTLAVYGDYTGTWLTVDKLPTSVVEALMATEDRRFRSHFGVDVFGIARAALHNIRAGGIVEGGSTITQQLAKNLFLTTDRTLRRKIQETMLALWLEHRYSKDEILTIYLNRVYFGAGTYGVDAASERYFGHSAIDLTLPESAMLVGLLKAPSRYSPASSPDLATSRTNEVIQNMVEAGYLTPDQAAAAKQKMAKVIPKALPGGDVRYFTDWVLSELPDYTGVSDRDLVIRTSLDPRLQKLAEHAVATAMDSRGKQAKASQAAMVVTAPDGTVLAMVGGRDYAKSQYNRATQAMRQPGSSFKLLVYLAGLEAGLTPDDQMRDSPIILEGWQPQNYGGTYRGNVTLREAFAKSINTVAVKLGERANRQSVVEMSRRLGIETPITARPSLALGTSEVHLIDLTAAYAVVANRGQAVAPHAITDIRDRTGRLLYRGAPPDSVQILSNRTVAEMTDLLAAVMDEGGTGQGAALDRPSAGKTGTSQDFRDAWFVGFTAQYVAGVWVGNDDASPMARVTGGGIPAQIWHRFMADASAGLPVEPLAGAGYDSPSRHRGLFQRLFGID